MGADVSLRYRVGVGADVLLPSYDVGVGALVQSAPAVGRMDTNPSMLGANVWSFSSVGANVVNKSDGLGANVWSFSSVGAKVVNKSDGLGAVVLERSPTSSGFADGTEVLRSSWVSVGFCV